LAAFALIPHTHDQTWKAPATAPPTIVLPAFGRSCLLTGERQKFVLKTKSVMGKRERNLLHAVFCCRSGVRKDFSFLVKITIFYFKNIAACTT